MRARAGELGDRSALSRELSTLNSEREEARRKQVGRLGIGTREPLDGLIDG